MAAPDPVRDYAERVLAGTIVAGPWVRKACRRHLDDLAGAEARGLVWRLDKALHAIEFFEHWLCHADGQPFRLAPWQRFIIGSLFGWYMMAGMRRFRTAYLEIGKGNGKTPMAAGIGLYGLVADSRDEPAAEIYFAATTREQANIGFRDAHIMASKSPALAAMLDIGEHNLAIKATHSFARPVSSEHKGLDGKRVHIGILDEVHEHPNNLVVTKIAAGVKGRRSPLIVEITNSGWDKTTVCWEHHEYSIGVVDGRVTDETWFAYVCALDDGDDWTDETVWPKANPNLGVSIQIEYLRAQVAAALGRPSEQRLVMRLNFCLWTEAAEAWLPDGAWASIAGPVDWRLLPDRLAGRTCVGGLDLASTTDLAALVLIFRESGPDGPIYDVLPFVWCPAATVEERTRKGLPYAAWVRAGALLTTPGNVIDHRAILRKVAELTARYPMAGLGFDRWGSLQLVNDLRDIGFRDDDQAYDRRILPIGQGFASMNAPTKELEVLVKDGRIRHGGHPVLAWAVANMVIEEDAAANVKPTKARASEKIDPVVALIIALATGLALGDWGGSHYYETAELLVLGGEGAE